MNQSTQTKGRFEDSVYISQGVPVEEVKQNLHHYQATSPAETNYCVESDDYGSEPSYQDTTEDYRSFAVNGFSVEAPEKKDSLPKGDILCKDDGCFEEKKHILDSDRSKQFQNVKIETYKTKLPLPKQNIKNGKGESEPEKPHQPHGSLVWSSFLFNKYLKGDSVGIRTKCGEFWIFVCKEHVALTEEIDFIKKKGFHKIIMHKSILVVTFVKLFRPIKEKSQSWTAKALFKRFTERELTGKSREIKSSNQLSDEDIMLYRLLGDVQYYLKSTGPYPTEENFCHLITTASKIIKFKW